MCLTVDYATSHPKSPSWKKATRDGVLSFPVDYILVYYCENTAHGYINRPFLSSNMAAMCAHHGGQSDKEE